MRNKITVCIPAHNNEKHIAEAIDSALMQDYPLKEILVINDASTDKTANLVTHKFIQKRFPVRLLCNEFNLGIGKNIEKLMTECKTKYILYLCADDVLTHPKVLSDVVSIFDANPSIGVIGCYKYYFMDGKEGAIGVCRDKNILTSSCCPSGMAFRRMDIVGTNKIFVEMPSIVAQYLPKYQWTMIEYDTVACRFSPGVNTGTKPSYYKESPTQNWIDLLGENYQDFPVFITLKNRAPKLLWGEICLHVRNDKQVLLKWNFWFYVLISLLLPSFILRQLTNFYRNRITRTNAKIIERPENV